MADRRGERRDLKGTTVEVAVTADGACVDVTPANGIYPPRVVFRSRSRSTPLVPCDSIRKFADEKLDAQDRTALLVLLDALTPWRRNDA